ncbi:MAG: dTDP-4-dehydrorhamnose 3,5-epimerase [Deltaproteobacteria bacterium]|nr:dTDP-4-dehydrorhamnose 3,5-epimerase [Deltaproteobacteria bacterium]
MKFTPSPTLPDIVVIEPQVFQDGRGFFTEMYHREKFVKGGIADTFVQDNRSRSCRGTLRGLHYQIRKPQAKLVWVLQGEIFDVAVDIRRNSPTFGRWASIVLSDREKKGVYIPPEFAHGFYVLSEEAEVFYKCSDLYAPGFDRGIRWDDPDLSIPWPTLDPILSEKDRSSPFLREAELPE